MTDKSKMVAHMQFARNALSRSIELMESNAYCIQIHNQICRSISEIEIARKYMVKQYAKECLFALFKKDRKSISVRQEIYKLFKNYE